MEIFLFCIKSLICSKLGEFEDKSSLSNIKNVKSDEKAKINGETLKWNVNSNELYYEGNSEKELPLSIEIKYEFNNKNE